MVSVRQATVADLGQFKIRLEDDREVWSIARMTGKEALRQSAVHSTDCYIAEDQGRTLCLFGCIPYGKGASFWMLFPKDIGKLPMSFFRKAEPVVAELLLKYEVLTSYVHQDNAFIIRLSQLMGFSVDDAKPYGVDEELFHRVYKRR